MRVVAIIQARMGSTRLPGKVLRPLAGRPMVQHVIDRARRAPGIAEVVIATSTLPEEEPLVAALAPLGVQVVRGSPDDVLARYAAAAEASRAEVIVRITSDCPLLSPEVTGRVVTAFQAGGCDYASNCQRRTFPRGLDTEAFSRAALDAAFAEATAQPEREHVTPFIWRRPERFRLRDVTDPVDRSHLRWTVDTPDDLTLAEAFYGELAVDFEYSDALAAIARHPDWATRNTHIAQKPV
jgi:spore coat polysaccharide biosynthesis protein SpsF